MRSWLTPALVALALSSELAAQSTPTKDPPVRNRRKPVPYTFFREADAMWMKRVWRTVDLREKMNFPLYYPEVKTDERISLFDLIKEGLLASPPRITAFANPALDDQFLIPMTPGEIETMFTQKELVFVDDPNNPGTFIPDTIRRTMEPTDIRQYWIKEDWFLDKQRSVLDVRILGLCPLKEKVSEGGEVLGYTPLFWIYFPEFRPLMARTNAFNPKNNAQPLSYDDIFLKRIFQSYIHKESNAYDRSINAYITGLDVLLEAERVKEDIARMEHDLWHF